MSSFKTASHSRRAFTLIELLTVIAIIGVLAAIIIPTVGKVRATARNAQCVSRLRDWASAIHLFANDNKGVYQVANWVSAASRPYQPYFRGKDSDLVKVYGECALDPNQNDGYQTYSFVVPSRGDINNLLTTTNGGVSVNGTNLGVPLGKISTPSTFLMMCDTMRGSSPQVNGTDARLAEYIAPLFGGANPGTRGDETLALRHGGRKINGVFGDGSVKTITGTPAGSGDKHSIYEMRTTWFMLN